jgi:hypothetical protein
MTVVIDSGVIFSGVFVILFVDIMIGIIEVVLDILRSLGSSGSADSSD